MEVEKTYQIKGGLYLVIDPSQGLHVLLPKVEAALKGGVSILQIWNNWNGNQDKAGFIESICSLAHSYHVPVLINEDWSWLKNTSLDGVHFDNIPTHWDHIKQCISRHFLKGITCGNDSTRIRWAIEQQLDYISFCSMFPSSSTDTCELVSFDAVRQTREQTSMPIFAAGGITLNSIPHLLNLGVDGVAVISAITKAENPEELTRQFAIALERKYK